MYSLADYDYELPPELIAQQPAERRDHSRLLMIDRATGAVAHQRFEDLTRHSQVNRPGSPCRRPPA